MRQQPLTAYLFDLDGTLIDSIDLILQSYRHTLRTHRGSVPPDPVWLAGVGTPLRAQFRAFTEDPVELEAMVETYRQYNYEHHDRLVREYPGVVDAVRTLKQRGARLGVVTSKMRAGCIRGLAACGFGGLFEVLVGADDVEKHKPDPAPVQRALAQLNADPTATVFVGDSPHDLVAGRAAGVRTAAVLWGPFSRHHLESHGPDYWLERPEEITRLG